MTKKANEKKAQVLAQGKLYKTEADIAKAIVAAEKKGNSVQNEYWTIAASLLVHLAKHKDIRIIRRVIEGFPEGMRKNSMLAYFEKFGSVRVLTEENAITFKGQKGDIVYDAKRKLNLAGALETPWWKAAKEPEYKAFDLDKMIDNVIRLADRKMKDGVSADKGDKLDAKKLAALKALQKSA